MRLARSVSYILFIYYPEDPILKKFNPCIEKNDIQYYRKPSGSEASNSIP